MSPIKEPRNPKNSEVATLGSGCFWCSEAVFSQLKGVEKVESGYSGGKSANPSYQDVCSGTTGHAETVQVTFDPSIISYEDILHIFFTTHDPTTLNRQGNDVGTQYRSVIFYHDQIQKKKSEEYKLKLDKSGAFNNPIVTAITPYFHFYAAEDYHQDYYRLHGSQPYCAFVIRPKVEKFEKVFKN